jgi:transcriptional regulator with XRE-family HTH domain
MTAEELRNARGLLRLSQSQMAKMLETDERTYRKYELGQRAMAVRIGRLATAYLHGYRPEDWPQRPRGQLRNMVMPPIKVRDGE